MGELAMREIRAGLWMATRSSRESVDHGGDLQFGWRDRT